MSRRARSSPGIACLGLLLAGAGPAHACSKVGFGGTLSPSHAFLVATATPDTVRTGAGALAFREEHGRPGGRAVHGQVVRVERIGGPAGARIPAGATRAVLVPWSFGADCRPERWTESARWTAPGTRGFFLGELRDPAHWVGGVPTFDVHDPFLQPYPHRGHAPVPDSAGRAPAPLTADAMFWLYAALPHPARLAADPLEAVRPLRRWIRDNPGPAGRAPAAGIVRDALAAAEAQRVRATASPLAGTYRFRVTLTGTAPRFFYVRTALHPSGPWYVGGGGDPDPAAPPRAGGYRLPAAAAPSPDALAGAGERLREGRGDAIRVLETPRGSPDGARVWRGEVDLGVLAAQLPSDPELRRFLLDHRAERGRRAGRGLPDDAPAEFTLLPDGRLRVEQAVALPGGRTLALEGERIGSGVLPASR